MQIPLQLGTGLNARIHFRLIKTIGAASQVLGFIKRDIRGFQQLVEFGGIVRRDGNADADVDHHLIAIEIERLMNRFADPHRQHRGIRLLIERRLNDGKFVAAETGDHVDIPDTAVQAICHSLEQLVAGRVTEGVVDALKMIDVEVQDRQPLSALNPFERLFELLVKKLAIRQASQRIMCARYEIRSSAHFASVTSSCVVTQPPPSIGWLTM